MHVVSLRPIGTAQIYVHSSTLIGNAILGLVVDLVSQSRSYFLLIGCDHIIIVVEEHHLLLRAFAAIVGLNSQLLLMLLVVHHLLLLVIHLVLTVVV